MKSPPCGDATITRGAVADSYDVSLKSPLGWSAEMCTRMKWNRIPGWKQNHLHLCQWLSTCWIEWQLKNYCSSLLQVRWKMGKCSNLREYVKIAADYTLDLQNHLINWFIWYLFIIINNDINYHYYVYYVKIAQILTADYTLGVHNLLLSNRGWLRTATSGYIHRHCLDYQH